jgi:hypothetical protein
LFSISRILFGGNAICAVFCMVKNIVLRTKIKKPPGGGC